MNKHQILREIKRTAEANGGSPLGVARFFKETGIAEREWAKYWIRWGDALSEAGYSPNKLQESYSDDYVLEQLIDLIRELGHYPVIREIKLRGRNDPGFPSHNVFQRRGKKSELVEMVWRFCKSHDGYDDVLKVIRPLKTNIENGTTKIDDNLIEGYVYLMKSGKYYKIGRSVSAEKRAYEIQLKLPEELKLIHKIKTDDPVGIEAYWHKRFAEKRMRGEWFNLTPQDISAFRRRKFM